VIGVTGSVVIAACTVVGALLSARIQAGTAARAQEREDAVRRDERESEERRRGEERAAEAERIELERQADVAAADRADVAALRSLRLAVSGAFVAQAQVLYRVLVLRAASDGQVRDERDDADRWNVLGERLGAVMVALDEPVARHAVAVADALQDALISLTGRREPPDKVDDRLATAEEQLRAFLRAVQAL
jgi:hypothetical protein